MMDPELESKILNCLPYDDPFLFVDGLTFVDDDTISGHYTFDKGQDFYRGHFKNEPVTPGVILLEMMGQIGMVSHAIYLLKLHEAEKVIMPIISNIEVDFLHVALPEEKLTVIGKKTYLRNNLLRSSVQLLDSADEVIAESNMLVKIILK